MDIEIQDCITLSDKKKYLVSSKTIYNNELYYLLTELNNKSNIKICLYTKRNTLIEITENDLIEKIIPYLIEESLINIKINNL